MSTPDPSSPSPVQRWPGTRLLLRSIQAIDGLVIALSVPVFLYLIAYTIEPAKNLLDEYAFPLTLEVVVAIVAIAVQLSVINMVVMRVRSETSAAESRVQHSDLAAKLQSYNREVVALATPGTILPDQAAVVSDIWQRARGQVGVRKLQVIGLNLSHVWGQLHPRLSGSDASRDWRIVLYGLDPTAEAAGSYLPERWRRSSQETQDAIRYYADDKQSDLEQRNVDIKLYAYDAVPPVNGYLYGDGDIYIGYSSWNGDHRILEAGYERILLTDQSDRANFYRTMFHNWLRELEAIRRPT